jgi:hypothetical protein
MTFPRLDDAVLFPVLADLGSGFHDQHASLHVGFQCGPGLPQGRLRGQSYHHENWQKAKVRHATTLCTILEIFHDLTLSM